VRGKEERGRARRGVKEGGMRKKEGIGI